MKCSEAEEKIYLYRELTAAERRDIDGHLNTCLLCRRTMSSVINMQDVVADDQAQVPPMTNEAQMTHRIMDTIRDIQNRETSRWEGVLQSLQTTFLRYGMAAISFALVSIFIAEYAGGKNIATVTKIDPRSAAKKTELNLASFHSAFFSAKEDRRQTPALISGCIVVCRQSPAPECDRCSDKFVKQ